MDTKRVKKLDKTNRYVYDISLDGTVVDAFSMLMCHNTDGFNFRKPDDFWFTEDRPYIASGYGRNTNKDEAYTDCEADVAWFEDHFLPFDQPQKYGGMSQKMGLGIDEYCDSCTQVKRKNYIDLMPDGKLKLVGNSIKSKKIPAYIEDFLNEGLPLYARGKGKEFLDLYYDYIEKIYNMEIPLKKIAALGKIKTSIETYKQNCKTLTTSGGKKARQAWYELAIKNKLDVHMGDTIYYINTGTSKGDSDVKRITKFFYVDKDNNKVDYIMVPGKTKKDRDAGIGVKKDLYEYCKSELKKEKQELKCLDMTELEYGRRLYPHLQEEDVIIFNCVHIPADIIESEDKSFVDESIVYNREKYINALNNKVAPLLVSFHREMRMTINEKGKPVSNILITHPKDRKYFSEEECEMISGEPLEPTDQDTYQEIMTMDDKEIRFWESVNEKPIFCDELGMDWDTIKSDYDERMKQLQEDGVKAEKVAFDNTIKKMSTIDKNKFLLEGILPKGLESIVDIDFVNGCFVSKKYDVRLGHIHDILDDCTGGEESGGEDDEE